MIFNQVRDKYSDVMTLVEFDGAEQCGAFIPDDGIGYYGTETHYSYSANVWAYFPPEGATHVHWYNR